MLTSATDFHKNSVVQPENSEPHGLSVKSSMRVHKKNTDFVEQDPSNLNYKNSSARDSFTSF